MVAQLLLLTSLMVCLDMISQIDLALFLAFTASVIELFHFTNIEKLTTIALWVQYLGISTKVPADISIFGGKVGQDEETFFLVEGNITCCCS